MFNVDAEVFGEKGMCRLLGKMEETLQIRAVGKEEGSM
jgi:hypothetical protein